VSDLVRDVCLRIEGRVTDLLLNGAPLLAALGSQRLPDLLAHAHVLLAEPLQLAVVKVVLTPALEQALVPLAAGIARLAREGVALNLVPVLAAGAQLQQQPVVLGVPGPRRGPV